MPAAPRAAATPASPTPTSVPATPVPTGVAATTPVPGATPAPAATPVPTAVPAPTPAPVVYDPPPVAGAFSLDLYRPGASVPQFDRVSCVAASMQTMANLIDRGKPDRSRATQKRFYQLARDITPREERRPGASIRGWIDSLEYLGYGDFEEMGDPSLTEALRLMARQMRITRKPAGLWVWHGEHAWVVSGFKATADPAFTDDFRVTAVWVEDPWSGRVSSIWGPGLRPHTLLSVKALAKDFTRDAPRFMSQYAGQAVYRVIAPVA